MMASSLTELPTELARLPTPLLTDDKTNRVIDDIVKRFKYQANPNSCEPTCIYNVLHELGDRDDRRDIQFSETRINQICGYKHPIGPNVRVIIPNLNKALGRTGYTARDRVRSTFDNLRSVLTDQSCSYPLLGLSYEYLRNEHDYRRSDGSDHVVIVFKANDLSFALYDPFEGLRPSMRRANLGYGKGIVVIPTTDILDYWENASVSTSWMLWVRKETIKTPTLEDYPEKKEVLVKSQ